MSDGDDPVDNIEDETMTYSLEIALKMIPSFDGNREELHKFLTCVDIVYGMCTTNAHKTSLLNVTKTKLAGPAYDLVKYTTFASWAELKVKLEQQYSEKRSIAQIQTELLNIRQNKDSVREFANKVIKLNSDLNDVCIKSQGEAAAEFVTNLNKHSALKAFVDGLNDPIKLIIKASRYAELSEAIEAACEEEKSLSLQKRFTDDRVRSCSKCGRNNHTTNQCYISKRTHHNRQTQVHSPQVSASYHFPNENSSNNNFNRQPDLFCRYCKIRGHTIDVCRKRAYQNSSRTNFSSNNQSGHQQNQNLNQPIEQNPGNGSLPSSSGRGTRIRDIRTAH